MSVAIAGDYFTDETSESEDAVDAAEGQGFKLPPRPSEDHPELPSDLSELADQSLVELMVEFVAWTDYAAAQLGLAVMTERAADRTVEGVIADNWAAALAADPKVSVTALRMMQLNDPTVRAARVAQDSAYAYKRLISDLTERYERDGAVLSRELTRRTAGEKPGRRFGA